MPLKALVVKAQHVYEKRAAGTRGHVFKDLLDVSEAKLAGAIHTLATEDPNGKLTKSTITVNFVKILHQVVLLAKKEKSFKQAESEIDQLAAVGENAITPSRGVTGLLSSLMGSTIETPEIVIEYRAFITLAKENLNYIATHADEAKSAPAAKVGKSGSVVALHGHQNRTELETENLRLQSKLKKVQREYKDVSAQLAQATAQIKKLSEEVKDESVETKEIISECLCAEIAFKKSIENLVDSEDAESKNTATIKLQLSCAISTILVIKDQAQAVTLIHDCEKLKEHIQTKCGEFKKMKKASKSEMDMGASMFFSPFSPTVNTSGQSHEWLDFYEAAFKVIEKLQVIKGILPIGIAKEKLQLYLFFAEKQYEQSKTHIALTPKTRDQLQRWYYFANT